MADDGIALLLPVLLACIFKQSADREFKCAWTLSFSRSLKMFLSIVDEIDANTAIPAKTTINSIKEKPLR